MNVSDFRCSNPEFEEYLRVGAFNDQQEQIGKTWVFMYEEKIIGFVTLAMGHVEKNALEDIRIDGYGNIPALLISHLATHVDYERRGVGRHMVRWILINAIESSRSVGCRLVFLQPEEDVVKFYEKMRFKHAKGQGSDQGNMYTDLKDLMKIQDSHDGQIAPE